MNYRRPYFLILVRDTKDSPWCIHGGDFERQVAVDERRDLIDGREYKASNVKVLRAANAKPATCDAAIAAFAGISAMPGGKVGN